MPPQTSHSQHAISVRETESTPIRTAGRDKRPLLDTIDDPVQGHSAEEYIGMIASTSALVAASSTKRAKRAETRECPVCGDHIPLRLLGQHYTLESSRVQTILDHVGDLEGFSDPHSSAHAPTQVRRRAAAQSRDASAAFASRLTKTISSIKRRRKARNLALRVVTRDEDDESVAGKGKGRAGSTAEQCPVCMQDVEGDPDVVAAHVDACLVHAELHQPGSNADEDAPLNIDNYADEGNDDPWEESETPDGVRRLRLRAGARTGATALGFVVRNGTVEDVEDEIDVEGDDLSAFGATQFTEADLLAESGASDLLRRHDTNRRTAEVEADLAIERARLGRDSQALIAALEHKVRLLVGAPADGAAFGCRICLETYSEPTVSTGCWHACCRACWLRCLNATGVCPICKRITVTGDLRRVYL